MHFATLLLRFLDIFGQFVQRQCVGNTHSLRQGGNRGLVSHPDDIINGEVIAKDDGLVRIKVDNGGNVCDGKPEEIEKVAVLTEVIGVVRIVHRGLVVAQENGDAMLYGLREFLTSVLINGFFDKGFIIIGFLIRNFAVYG